MTPAVILAAGRSSRFGRSKALLPVTPGGQTFVERLIAACREARAADVLVVGRGGDAPLRDAVLRSAARFVVNPDPDRGQLSSLVTALDAVARDDVRGVMVLLVDIPLIDAASIAAVRDAFLAGDAPIARAACGGRHGHPVIFGRELFEELRSADPGVGAKAVVRAHESEVLNVEVPDRGVLSDVDTAADYRDLFGRDP